MPPPLSGLMGLAEEQYWQLAARGFEPGPHEQSDVVAAIERGDLIAGRCRRLGEQEWRRLADEPVFAEAVRRSVRRISVVGLLRSLRAIDASWLQSVIANGIIMSCNLPSIQRAAW